MRPVDYIINYLEGFVPLPAEAKAALSAVLHYKRIGRKEHIVWPNQVHEYISFIYSGCVREYYIDDREQEVALWFGFPYDVVVALPSFIAQQAGHTGIQALDDTEVLQINRTDLYALFDQFHAIERLGRLLTEQYLINSDNYIQSLQTQSAQVRYENLLARRPQILQTVPLSMIASYLGISQETLSRIRAKR